MAGQKVKLIYQYIAQSDPYFAVEICKKYGYTVPPVRNARELGGLLQELVTIEGEQAFIDIMDKHPDKELILEMYGPDEKKEVVHAAADGNPDCGCKKKQSGCGCKKCGCQEEKHFNATGPDQTAVQNSHMITGTQTGIVILSCAMIIALAIMSKK